MALVATDGSIRPLHLAEASIQSGEQEGAGRRRLRRIILCAPTWSDCWNHQHGAILSRRCGGPPRACVIWRRNFNKVDIRSRISWSVNCSTSWATVSRQTARLLRGRSTRIEMANSSISTVESVSSCGRAIRSSPSTRRKRSWWGSSRMVGGNSGHREIPRKSWSTILSILNWVGRSPTASMILRAIAGGSVWASTTTPPALQWRESAAVKRHPPLRAKATATFARCWWYGMAAAATAPGSVFGRLSSRNWRMSSGWRFRCVTSRRGPVNGTKSSIVSSRSSV